MVKRNIYYNNKIQYFITAINDTEDINNKELYVEFFNYLVKSINEKIRYDKINPYQAIFLDLKSFKRLRKFLKNKRGFCKINLPTKNIFNRILT